MLDLAMHLIRPIVANPDDVEIQVIESEDVTILEAVLHDDDRAALEDDGGRTLRAIRNVLSAAAGRRKASIELVEAFSEE